jgi:hypothetical protein
MMTDAQVIEIATELAKKTGDEMMTAMLVTYDYVQYFKRTSKHPTAKLKQSLLVEIKDRNIYLYRKMQEASSNSNVIYVDFKNKNVA